MLRMEAAKISQLKYSVFLRDVFLLSLTAFGGPQVHLERFIKKLVHTRKYLSEDEFREINSLCQLLPGPTSTQTITAIGHKLGGRKLAWLTILVWAFPSVFIMTLIALKMTRIENPLIPNSALTLLPAMAVGFMLISAIRISKLFIQSGIHLLIAALACVSVILIHYPAIIPLVLFTGGVLTNYTSNKVGTNPSKSIKILWFDLIKFFGVFGLSGLLALLTRNKLIILFENLYRFGSIVFGGGNVLIPMMYDQFVLYKHYFGHELFMNGMGLLQAIPGPVFGFAAYTGGLVMSDGSIIIQLAGSLTAAVAIFMPGLFLIFFLYPLWNHVKQFRPVLRAMEGVNAASAGLAVSAVYLLSCPLQVDWSTAITIIAVSLLVYIEKIPSPFIVALTMIFGYYLS